MDLAWLLFPPPALLIALGALPAPGGARPPARWLGLIEAAALAALAGTGAGLLAVIAGHAPAIGAGAGAWFGPWLGLDRLGAPLAVTVALVGAVVVRYSRHYLDGDPGQARFFRRLSLTLGAALVMVMAGNLALFALAWGVTSLGLHGLLQFYPERAAAVRAARKKFIAARLGDACLLAACLLLRSLGTLDFGAIATAAATWQNGGAAPSHAAAIGTLVVAAALLKSAPFPLHGWLTEVMETPTPVSALLHAGIINAGALLLLRFSGWIGAQPGLAFALGAIGLATAVLAAAIMLTQTSIKGRLAHSTVAQMGFVLLQLGLGAYAAAGLHLVAHALYKAHAFLAAGQLPAPRGAATGAPSALGQVGLAAAMALAALAAIALQPAHVALITVTALGLGFGLLSLAADRSLPRAAMLAAGVLMAALWLALQLGAQRWFAPLWPLHAGPSSPALLALAALSILAFAALACLPALAQRGRHPALRAWLANGLYVNTFGNRLLDRLWPVAPRA